MSSKPDDDSVKDDNVADEVNLTKCSTSEFTSPSSSMSSKLHDGKTPEIDFNQYIHNLNGWIWQCQVWFQFYSNYRSLNTYIGAGGSVNPLNTTRDNRFPHHRLDFLLNNQSGR